MTTVDLPAVLAEQVSPESLRRHCEAHGWFAFHKEPAGTSIMRRHDDDNAEILLPQNQSLLDYTERVIDAVRILAKHENRLAREVLSELLLPEGDFLRYRVDTPATKTGFLSFPGALELLESARESILSAACTVLRPQKFYPRTSKAETDAFLSSCKLGTERGSFVATVLCPLFSSGVRESIQIAIPGVAPGIEDTFGRKVVVTIMQSGRKIVDAIESDRLDSLLTPEDDPSGVVLSANICDALAQTEDLVSEARPLVIEAQLSPLIPASSAVPTRVSIKSEYFPGIRAVADSLRPRIPEPKEAILIGRVASLHGTPEEDGHPFGDIVFAFQDENDRIAKARVSLDVASYAVACDAHRDGHYVSLRGIFRRSPRVGLIEDVSDFKDITK